MKNFQYSYLNHLCGLLLFGFVFSGCENPIVHKFAEISMDLQKDIAAKKEKRSSILAQHPGPAFQRVHQLTLGAEKEITQFIEDLHQYLEEEGGYSMGSDTQMGFTLKKGKGEYLQKVLRSYVDSLNQVSSGFSFGHIAKDGDEISDYIGTERASKDFAHINFESTPNVGAFAILHDLHARLLDLELQAYEKLIEEEHTTLEAK